MTKTIRVSDEVYDNLSNDAKAHYRTIGGQIEYLYEIAGGKPLSVAVFNGTRPKDDDAFHPFYDEPKNQAEEDAIAAQIEDDFNKAKRYYADPTYTDLEETA